MKSDEPRKRRRGKVIARDDYKVGKETADLSTTLRSGRDDKSASKRMDVVAVDGSQSLDKFVISTGA
jgi:hypothetical protein